MTDKPNPGRIMQTATAFWASKVLLTAIEFEVFTVLGEGPLTADELGERLGIHPRGRYDFFDALVALEFLERDGDGPEGRYENTPDTGHFLDKKRPTYVGGLPEMLNRRLFGFWNGLGEALRTGEAQSEMRHHQKPVFEELYADEARLGGFLQAMSSAQAGNFQALGAKFDWSKATTVTDAGGALGLLSCLVAKQHPHLHFTSFDLPPVKPHAEAFIARMGLSDRVTAVAGDFFADPLPEADVVTMGNILHDWNLEKKKLLIQKAYDALPAGGTFIAVENIIDDARRKNAFGLLMSLNMLIELGDGFDYTGAQFDAWCKEIGFARTEVVHLGGPSSAAIATK